jgi:hypothetical protein
MTVRQLIDILSSMPEDVSVCVGRLPSGHLQHLVGSLPFEVLVERVHQATLWDPDSPAQGEQVVVIE